MPTAPSALVPEKVAGNKGCLLPAGFFGFQTTLVLCSARLLSVCWVAPPAFAKAEEKDRQRPT